MSSSSSVGRDRRGRIGVSLMFVTNGVLFSALLPRYPELKQHLGLSDAGFGLTVAAFAAGAICAAGAAAPLVRRLGAQRVTAVGSVLLASAMLAAGASPTVWALGGSLFVAGLLDAIVDAAQNVTGIAVERSYGRSIINSLHAVWSLGAAAGGAIGAAGAAWGVGIGVQMLVNGAVWSVVAVAGSRLASGAARPVEVSTSSSSSGAARVWRLLLPLVVLASCGTLVEDVANNWSVLFVHDVVGAPAAVAGLALTVMLGAQLVGRLLGDPMTNRWGRDRVARAGGLSIALGATLTILAPGVVVAFVGLGLAGLGCATLVPAAFAAADRIPGLATGSGVAVLGWLMRLGFLATSPSMGLLSDATSLRTAFAIPLVAGLVAATMAHLGLRRSRPDVRAAAAA